MELLSQCLQCQSPLGPDDRHGLCGTCLGSVFSDLDVFSEELPSDEDDRKSSKSDGGIAGYTLEGEIARGGMGVVYRARHAGLDREVALKMIHSGPFQSAFARERFRIEAEAAANLHHPNIVPVYDVGQSDGRPYFTMKLIENGSLRERLADFTSGPGGTSRQTHRKLVSILIKVAHAVHYAHLSGVLHRDLKPSNILLDDQGEPHVSDFGLAKRMGGEEDLTIHNSVLGTPAYMAPEVARSGAASAGILSDIYSLGAMLYHFVTGQPPVQGESTLELIHKSADVSPVDCSLLEARTDRDLKTVCLKSLEKEPDRRYQSAAEFAEDLERWSEGRAVKARPVGTAELAYRWCRRNPAISIATLAAIVLLVGFVSHIYSSRETIKAERADSQRLHYFANMSLLQNDWEKGQLQRMRGLLDETENYPQRGFEWHYWNAQLGLAERTLVGHSQGVTAIAFSSDGRWLASAGNDRTIRIWDVTSGRTRTVLEGHEDNIFCICFASDGKKLISGGKDKTVRVWNLSSGTPEFRLDHEASVRTVAVVPGRRDHFIAGVEDGSISVWDLHSGGPAGKIEMDATIQFSGNCAFSPDGRYLALVSYPRQLIDWSSGTVVAELEEPRHRSVGLPAFSSDGTRIAFGGSIYDTSSGELLRDVQIRPSKPCMSAFSPDGRYVASVDERNAIRIWDPETRSTVMPLKGHLSFVYSVAFSPDGRWLASSSEDGTIKLWSVSNLKRFRMTGFVKPVKSVAVTSDGRYVAAGGDDSIARIYDTMNGAEVQRFTGHEKGVSMVRFLDRGAKLLSSSKDGTAKIWDIMSGELERTLSGQGAGISCFGVSRDERLIATVGDNMIANVWDRRTGALIKSIATGQEHSLNAVRFSPDGIRMLTAADDHSIKIWDFKSGEALLTFDKHMGWIGDAVFFPDGKRILSGGNDDLARIWEVETGRELHVLRGHLDSINEVDVTADGKRAITASDDGTVKVWDAESGRELITLEGQSGYAWAVAASEDGKTIVSGGHEICIWQGR